MPRAYGDYDARAVSKATALACRRPSKTVQSQRDEADINVIVRNFGITGKLPTNIRAPAYGDFTGVDDYQSAIEAIRSAEKSFMQMPSDVRDRFQNDPQQFVAFCGDERNLEEMKKLGLAVGDVVEPVVRASDGAPVG